LAEIGCEERRLAGLKGEVARATQRIDELQTELAFSAERTGSSPASVRVAEATTLIPLRLSSDEKVALFRSLFRGRPDVFPRRWENPRTGRSGYSPACSNEWLAGICEKHSVGGRPRSSAVCGDCRSRAFLPVTDAEMLKHLQGKQVMGVYPLLEDETCWLLAADFDDEGWQEDVGAFRETCQAEGIEVAVERSRSGNGAHAWFFFAEPVQVQTARQMGCFLITETMSRRHQLSMRSYDRLFPNQDTMPKGGFGNLIALPLQWDPRRNGNTEFLDGALHRFTDQWAFLAGITRLGASLVHRIADDATRMGRVIGVRLSETDGEDAAAPWLKRPSGEPAFPALVGPFPSEVKAVLAQRLFVEKTGLPSPLISQLKRLASFQNPEFYKKQSMRFSTALTPRVISCAEDLGQHLALPRGCLDDIEALLAKLGAVLSIRDERVEGEAESFTFRGSLTPVQEGAAHALLGHDTGVVVAPPGFGKTVVGAFLVAARARSTLILVHRKPLLDQWVSQLAMFLGLGPSEIGQIGAGKRLPSGRLDVAMIQSVVRRGRVDDAVASYGHVIVDECHHLGAFTFERVLSEVKAKFVAGLTATPYRRDGHQPIIHMQLGPVRFAAKWYNADSEHPLNHRLIVRETGFVLPDTNRGVGIQEVYAALTTDARRNELIVGDVKRALEEGRSPIVLTERRDHLELLADKFRGATQHLVVLQGGMGARKRREAFGRVASIPDDESRLLLATGRYVGEGFDDARLDTLFLALPVSWKGTLVQYVGRLHRSRPGKTEARIYDYVDAAVPVLSRMFERRLRGYRAIGYRKEESSATSASTKDMGTR
jgi:superfamily II DNA or RNA helicase